jgi:hypothetical protein
MVFAAVAPAVAGHFSLVLPAVWILFAPILLVVIGQARTRAGEQLTPLQSALSSRAPPVSLPLD